MADVSHFLNALEIGSSPDRSGFSFPASVGLTDISSLPTMRAVSGAARRSVQFRSRERPALNPGRLARQGRLRPRVRARDKT